MKRLAATALVLGLASSTAAFADTMTLNSFALGSATSTPLHFNVTAYDPATTTIHTDSGVQAGELNVSVISGSGSGPSQSYLAYCVDLFQGIAFNTGYNTFSLVAPDANLSNSKLAWFTSAKATDMSKLFTEAASKVVDTTTSAAFQLAVWAIEYESSTNGYSLGKIMTGTTAFATATDGSAAETAAITQANNWLAGMTTFASNYDIKVEYDPSIQDQVVATKKVPEPAGYALVGTALGLLALSRRRNAARTPVSAV